MAQRTAAPGDWPGHRGAAAGGGGTPRGGDRGPAAPGDARGRRARCPTPSPSTSRSRRSEEARRRAPDRAEVAIEVDAPIDAVVLGSRVQLRRALANLLDNAGHHARTTIRLSVHERDGRVRVLVDDDGPGIAEDDRERVFGRFVRLDDHRARRRRRGRARPVARAPDRGAPRRHRHRGDRPAGRRSLGPRPPGRAERSVRSGRSARCPGTVSRSRWWTIGGPPTGSSATIAAVVASR